MQFDNHQSPSEPPNGASSMGRRREILRRIGKASVIAGASATPLAAMATGTRRWCRHPIDTTRCVQASISGMGSVVMSAQASNEVCGKKCSHYASTSNWPSSCSNGTSSIVCNSSTDSNNTRFKTAFKCDVAGTFDSLGVAISNSNCLLNKSLPTLCRDYSNSVEAHWATALGNANKLASPTTGAPFPYTPAQVVGHYGDAGMRASAYAFYTTYCENYS
jgi:Tfp pilus assembly major pilin PilA